MKEKEEGKMAGVEILMRDGGWEKESRLNVKKIGEM